MAIAVSAPGKVFLAGGYLVLDQQHTALTFSLDARIHAIVRETKDARRVITVQSPQFQEATWTYECGEDLHLRDVSKSPNPFVATALQYALTYSGAECGSANLNLPWNIIILADNDYYSQTSSHLSQSSHTGSTARFRNFDAPINKVNKTGLGSSAALVTALVGAITHSSFSKAPNKRPSDSDLTDRLHRLAQLAHCAAQGKVGSGFDVASAVYGPCIYRRFSPTIPEKLPPLDDGSFSKDLVALVNNDSAWDYEINAQRKVAIPPGLRLVMCDVDCGSETPGMVKQVLKWREQNRQVADTLWQDLQRQNDELADRLHGLSTGKEDQGFMGLKDCISGIRASIRKMSDEAKVPIEPQEQTALLDACSAVEGVVGGVVPGAGGYDAITLLIEDEAKVIERLKEFLAGWKFGDHGGRVRLLDTKGEMQGVRLENVEAYKDWVSQ